MSVLYWPKKTVTIRSIKPVRERSAYRHGLVQGLCIGASLTLLALAALRLFYITNS